MIWSRCAHSAEQAEQVKARLAEMAGAQGSGLQRGQDAHRAPRSRRVRLPGVQRPPLPQRQAADQTEQGGRQTDPGTARRRDAALRGANAEAVIARLNPIIRGWAAYYRSVVSSRRSPRWTTTCGGSPTSGPSSHIRTSRSAGSSPATSASSTRPGRTGGCSATATAAPTWSSSPGPDRPAPDGHRRRRLPDDPALTDYWARRRRRRQTPAGSRHCACSCQAGRPLPALRGLPAARRP